MNTDFKPSFFNSIKKIIDPALKEEIEQVIKSVEDATAKKDIPALKKLKGKKKKPIYYRIKIDGYRIGVTIENDIVTFAIFMPRKDFYRFFP